MLKVPPEWVDEMEEGINVELTGRTAYEDPFVDWTEEDFEP